MNPPAGFFVPRSRIDRVSSLRQWAGVASYAGNIFNVARPSDLSLESPDTRGSLECLSVIFNRSSLTRNTDAGQNCGSWILEDGERKADKSLSSLTRVGPFSFNPPIKFYDVQQYLVIN